jgi:hypothetical protein
MLYVKTPEFQNAWGWLDECRHSLIRGNDPLHMRLLGVSGLGKSFLQKHYRNANPPTRQGGRTVVPVAYIPIPSSPTVRSIYISMLTALGQTDPRGTADALRHRTVTLYRNCSVELCLFDEINHFVDGGRIKYRQAAADAIKMAVESIQLPSVFSGAKRSLALYEQNMQFRSRVTCSLTLRPFSLDQPRFDELCGFINALGCSLIGADAGAHLASDDVAERLFYATDGIHRNLCRFLYGLKRRDWTTPEQLAHANLASAFRDYLWEDAPEALNPFSAKFPFRRLNRANEPYVPTEIDGDNHAS